MYCMSLVCKKDLSCYIWGLVWLPERETEHFALLGTPKCKVLLIFCIYCVLHEFCVCVCNGSLLVKSYSLKVL